VTGFLLRRVLLSIPTLLVISAILYGILALAPGDPFGQLALNPDIPPEVRINLRKQFGLDDPVPIQYARWVENAARGNWGYSFVSHVNVSVLIGQRLPTTLWVIGSAFLLSIVIAVPIAAAGIDVIGIDSSAGMLAVCRGRAEAAGVSERLDLRHGDLVAPPVEGPLPLVICPFRSYLHLRNDRERRRALGAVRGLLAPDGRFVFDVFAPAPDDIAETHGRWLEREPGIFERADWDTAARTLTLSVKGRGQGEEATMSLAWLSPLEWRMLLDESGFEVEECYGWFDRTPSAGGEDSIWITRPTAR